ncbi:MAG: 3-deoxy-D-manno-octulosonic acid transferase [Chlamydiota bacterium]
MIVNFFLFLYLLGILPKLLFDRAWRGKRHPGFLQRLGFSIPANPLQLPVIWIHAVSVGEVKAAQPLFRELYKKNPKAFFLITTTTATGRAEALRSLPEANAFAYLPLDFSWVVNRFVRYLRPQLFILIESDFWPNLLKAIKKQGGKVVLVSGKLSERSAHRFKQFSFLSKKLFSYFDLICVQNQEHLLRFLPLISDPSRIHISGNLKLDIQPQAVDLSFWKNKFQIPENSPVITISCTHAPEEELLLDALEGGEWLIFLAPRHPERFEEVAQLLQKRNIPFLRWSKFDRPVIKEKVLLIDSMGKLPICYAMSRLSIVAGSFIPTIGGHNILEPCLYGTPVFFGPHMFSQSEFVSRALEAGAGLQVSSENLCKAVHLFFEDSLYEKKMRIAATELCQRIGGSTARTFELIQSSAL